MKERKIKLWPDPFHRPIEVSIPVPDEFDAEEYIDAYFDSILRKDTKYNCEWEFID